MSLQSLFGMSRSQPGDAIDPFDPKLAAKNRRLGLWITLAIAASVYASYIGRWLIYPAVFKK